MEQIDLQSLVRRAQAREAAGQALPNLMAWSFNTGRPYSKAGQEIRFVASALPFGAGPGWSVAVEFHDVTRGVRGRFDAWVPAYSHAAVQAALMAAYDSGAYTEGNTPANYGSL